MQLQDLLGIGIVGVALSLSLEWLKVKLGTGSTGTKLVTLALSAALGAGYWLLRDTELLKSIAGVLASATVVYSFVLKKPSEDR